MQNLSFFSAAKFVVRLQTSSRTSPMSHYSLRLFMLPTVEHLYAHAHLLSALFCSFLKYSNLLSYRSPSVH